MKHIAAYQTPEIFCGHLNNIFEGTEEIFENLFSLENISKEAELLNRAEESIPEDLKFNLELDLILKRNKSTSQDYYKGLTEGKNLLFDMAESHINESDMGELKSAMSELFEGFKSLNGKNKEAILEQITSSIDNAASLKRGPNDVDDLLGNIKSTTDTSGILTHEGGWWGLLKKLFNAITENGSAIGILHLVLDVVGLIGDFFGPVGMIADVLNGIIYMVRGKWVLATISFVAAMLPFAGNIFARIFKAGSKTGAEAIKIATVMGKSTKVSDDAVKLLAKASPDSIKALDYMAKSSKKVLPGLRGFISRFFRDFIGKLVSWVPFIGKPLQKFFNSIAKLFDGYVTKTLKFSDDFTKASAKIATHSLDDFFKAASKPGTEIVAGTISKNIGKEVTQGTAGLLVKDVSGKVVAELPAAFIKNSDHIAKRWGGIIGKETTELMAKNSDHIVDLYRSIAGINKAAGEAMGLVNRVGSKVIGGFIVTKQIPMFIGKQIYKLFANMQGMDLSDSELEAIGNVAVSTTMQDIMNKNLEENPNQSYDVPYVDAITNSPGQEVLKENQRLQAERFGLPGIGDVVYYTSGTKDKIPDDVQKFYKDIIAEDPTIKERVDRMDIGTSSGLFESIAENNTLKHIKPF